jgi:hypothetical protein
MLNQSNLICLVDRWTDTGLTERFEDKTNISLCLQSQLKYNESNNIDATFKLISIPLLIRIFSESKAFKRNQFVNYLEDAKPSQIVTFGIKLDKIETKKDESKLDKYAEKTASIAQYIMKELDEAFADVNNQEIIFHHFGILKDGTITMAFN